MKLLIQFSRPAHFMNVQWHIFFFDEAKIYTAQWMFVILPENTFVVNHIFWRNTRLGRDLCRHYKCLCTYLMGINRKAKLFALSTFNQTISTVASVLLPSRCILVRFVIPGDRPFLPTSPPGYSYIHAYIKPPTWLLRLAFSTSRSSFYFHMT